MKFRDRLTDDIVPHFTLILELHNWKTHQQPDFLNYLIYDAFSDRRKTRKFQNGDDKW